MMARILIIFFALFLAIPAQAQTFPELTGRVVDEADLLSPADEAQLTQKLATVEAESGRQFVVATINDLQDYPIEEYGYQLGRKWGIGTEENDDGLLLLIAPNDRKVRIEVGYGLEGIVTDAFSSITVQNVILPRFRENDMAGGILAGADALITQISLPEAEAREYANSIERSDRQRDRSGNTGMIIFWLFILLFFVLPVMFSGRKGRRYRGGAGPVIIWGPGSGGGFGSGSSGGSSWGGGGFGGGGFSGGGGSFGGGGASGGW